MKDKKEYSILSTKNYNKFKFIDGNRDINQKKLEKLIDSMKEKQLVIPICVNNKKEIIDGQHRFSACKALNLPVYYYVVDNYGVDEMTKANLVSSVWTRSDFLNLYIQEDFQQYKYIRDIIKDKKIGLCDILKILATFSNLTQLEQYEEFDSGNLDLSEEDINNVNDFLDKLETFSFFEDYKKTRFISAFLDLYMQEKYNHEQMEKKLQKRAIFLKKQLSKWDYLDSLANNIYTFGKASKHDIFYDKTRKKFY